MAIMRSENSISFRHALINFLRFPFNLSMALSVGRAIKTILINFVQAFNLLWYINGNIYYNEKHASPGSEIRIVHALFDSIETIRTGQTNLPFRIKVGPVVINTFTVNSSTVLLNEIKFIKMVRQKYCLHRITN